ncbi:chemotaxis protein CheD [Sphingobium boeckii]|uniref:Probable chemoreceptor glutamine deamidase CheD n=1 Tax=Sphingobium boeckii TaxID=1082345 RepID=A0A7W9EDL3_9SPHN|nr:chemotaxis protein CheD [Sphingobium boeckii]MBB5685232.1 chemotaxis protein CheD [Sphingobium boeckii]
MRRVPIIQGELSVIAEPGVMISTLLGSCVAVCLQDPVARVGGMNHFLLVQPESNRPLSASDEQRYGVHAMELLINGMMQHGAMRNRLRGHLYGGANIIAGLAAIGTSNAKFARAFMETEGIEIGRCELGGTLARRVDFIPYEGRVRSMVVRDVPPPVIARAALAEADGDVELF